jgi:hypothetical protein
MKHPLPTMAAGIIVGEDINGITGEYLTRNFTGTEQLGKKQALGEATNLGCPGFETPNAITKTVSRGQTRISGKTAFSRGGQTRTIPTRIPRGQTTALTATTTGGTTTL